MGILSGGERTRLALCQLLLSPCNFLILDEPTNHLDIQSKEVLKRALINYEGTFIVVSHDREFLDGLTNRIWDIQDKTLKIYHYDVKEYLSKKMANEETDKPSPKKIIKEVEKIESPEEVKELKRKKNLLQNNIKRSEELISQLEEKITQMDKMILELDYSDKAKAEKTISVYEQLKQELDLTMISWETQVGELEKLHV